MKFIVTVIAAVFSTSLVSMGDERAKSWDEVSADSLKVVLQTNLEGIRSDAVGVGSDLAGYVNTSKLVVTKGKPPQDPLFLVEFQIAEVAPSDLSENEILKRAVRFVEDSIVEEDNTFYFSLTVDLQNSLFTSVDGKRTLNPDIIRVALNPKPNNPKPNKPPVITPIDAQSDLQGATKSIKVEANDPDDDTPLIYVARGLPTGLTMDATGTITGKLESAGSFTVVISVSDQKPSGSSSLQFQWLVLPAKTFNPFDTPVGLSMPLDSLLACLGYNSSHRLDGVPFSFTTQTCIELAISCYRRGLYTDAAAIADHGLQIRQSGKLMYIRGCAELALGEGESAFQSAKQLIPLFPRDPSTTNEWVSGVNDPIAVRFMLGFRAIRAYPKNASSSTFASLSKSNGL